VLNFGVRRQLVTRNVALLLPPEDLPKAAKPEPNALDEEEVKRLLEAARIPSTRSFKRNYLTSEPWFAPAVAFSVYTGARRGEVCGLKWADVNLAAKSVTIRRWLADTKSAGSFFKEPKNGKARTIALPVPLVAILKQHRIVQGREHEALGVGYEDGDIVFARPDGSFVQP
jgi:integrase